MEFGLERRSVPANIENKVKSLAQGHIYERFTLEGLTKLVWKGSVLTGETEFALDGGACWKALGRRLLTVLLPLLGRGEARC